jgi:hypothetical protein
MRKTVAQLERELEYARKFENLYREEKRKYDERFEDKFNFIQDDRRNIYSAKEDMMEIIRWLVNPETASDPFRNNKHRQ